jgi:signal transduction histidine kinase
MNIIPPKPVKKALSPPEIRKEQKTKPPEAGIFTRILLSSVDETPEAEQIKEREFEELSQLHEQFKSAVNHEINNPLCVVQGMAELMSRTGPQELSQRILKNSAQIKGEISGFNSKDIASVGRGCRNAPLSEIAFRKDLIGCYLAKVISPLTVAIKQCLDEMEKALNIGHSDLTQREIQVDKVKNALNIIRRQSERMRVIIDKLEKLLPEDIEIKQYLEDLKMVNLR